MPPHLHQRVNLATGRSASHSCALLGGRNATPSRFLVHCRHIRSLLVCGRCLNASTDESRCTCGFCQLGASSHRCRAACAATSLACRLERGFGLFGGGGGEWGAVRIINSLANFAILYNNSRFTVWLNVVRCGHVTCQKLHPPNENLQPVTGYHSGVSTHNS
jgi:hypothetical protein